MDIKDGRDSDVFEEEATSVEGPRGLENIATGRNGNGSRTLRPSDLQAEEPTPDNFDKEESARELTEIAIQIVGETIEQTKFLVVEHTNPAGKKLSDIIKEECVRAGDLIEIASTFQHGLALIERGYKPTIVISDVETIPGLSGYHELPTEQLPITTLKNSGSEVVIVTTQKNKRNAMIAFQQGANYIITRPIEPFEPRLVIGKILEERRNKRLNEGISKKAFKDKLTGLFNRRYFEYFLEREVNEVKACEGNVSLLMIDIDHFKDFNDTYGHDVGDIVLEKLGMMIKRYASRPNNYDVPTRYGGEEFMVLYPNTTTEQATIAVLRLQKKLEVTPIYNHEGKNLYVTVSGGLVGFSVHDGINSAYQSRSITPNIVKKVADAALYASKKLGRKRIIEADVIQTVVTYGLDANNLVAGLMKENR